MMMITLLLLISGVARVYGAAIAYEANMSESDIVQGVKSVAALLFEPVAIYYIIKRHLLT